VANPAEVWKSAKHGFDVWPDIERHAAAETPMKDIDAADLERMKWHGFFYRKRDKPGRYMNRIRITAGELTAAQAKEISYIAYEFGHGIVDVTTRANLQVQGLEIQHLPEVRRRLERVGLTSKQTGHDNIRNVFAHPYSGLLPGELIDTRPLCHDVTAVFIDHRDYADLPRKMNICLNGSDHHSAHFWTQDISFLATRDEGGDVLFRVLIGGTQGQNPQLVRTLPVLVRPDQVTDVTRAILDLFRERGSREQRNAARFRFLVEQLGVHGVLEWLAERLPYALQPSFSEPVPAATYDDLIGWHQQRDPQLWTMGLSVPLGRLGWQQLEGLAVLSKKWSDGQMRTTHEQGLAVINIPRGFRDAAATAAAALGLSVHADPFDRNTMACTGSQFCNIAVTETKGHMFQLMDRLRKKGVMLHGIRIHMSGCPSSCAQHFTADIGLKGVRVRRLLGTREGFDVFLGGGVAGQVHMGLPFRLGVDVDQLPTLIEDVVTAYYRHHQPGQSFSAYWRAQLDATDAIKLGDDDYQVPIWLCEACEHQHRGEDPPVFCPRCAGLRRNFARLEGGSHGDGSTASGSPAAAEPAVIRRDGFVVAAKDADLDESQGLTVTVAGHDFALFRSGGQVHAIDSACPHEGAPLAEGEIANGVVTCPWHGWTFKACTGCSIDPPQNDVRHYETRVENGDILIKPDLVTVPTGRGPSGRGPSGRGQNGEAVGNGEAARAPSRRTQFARPVDVELPVLEVRDEAPDVRTFSLDNSAGALPLDLPGRFARVAVTIDGDVHWRSFTISSSPTTPARVDLTIKRNPDGVASTHLFEHAVPGSTLRLKGPQGGFCFDPVAHREPLVLISAGSGVTPMMSIARYLHATGASAPCTFLYGARTLEDVIFRRECEQLETALPGFRYVVSLSQPPENWRGPAGRIGPALLDEHVPDVRQARVFLCGPHAFQDVFETHLLNIGVAPDRIHTEEFHPRVLTGKGV